MEAETTAVPFAIRRVFTIRATRAGLVGGRHAHHRCHQLLVALEGRCVVRVVGDRADLHAEFTLDDPASGLWIPPGLWAEQRYETDPMVLMVLCDRAYEADDYIRDFAAYLAYRSA
jgi:dTDP-4-dehydrorhamnose 3,5-epimerase-like enzyme